MARSRFKIATSSLILQGDLTRRFLIDGGGPVHAIDLGRSGQT